MPGPGFRKEPDEVGRFLAPKASYFYRQDDELAPSGVEQFWVCSLFALSSCVERRPSKGACMSAGLPFPGEGGKTKVASMASCAPPHRLRPLAMTSIRRSSWRCKCWRLRSATLVLVVTRARLPGRLSLLRVLGARPDSAIFQLVGTQHGGRRKGQEHDGTGTGGLTGGERAAGGGEEASETSGMGKWCWRCMGWR